MKTRSSYLICTTPRTGSWLLAGGLELTRLAGNPREYFGIDHEDYWVSRLRITGDDYLDKILEAGTTPNGCFGAKVHWSQMGHMMNRLGRRPGCRRLAAQRLLPAVFPNLRYVWLSRYDTAQQAVSYARAIQSGVWRQAVGTPSHASAPVFDYAQVARLEEVLVEQDGNWRRYFAAGDVKPLRITYEELAGDYDETIAKVLDFLGAPAVSVPPPCLRKQADHVSEEWVRRYLALRQQGVAV